MKPVLKPRKKGSPFLTPEGVAKGLETKSFGRALVCLDQVGSTNDVALQLARDGAAEGTVVTALDQTAGRGRQGREWFASRGKSLVFSIVLWPRLSPDEVPEITLAAAVAAAKTLEERGFSPGIKWPNDLQLGGRKVCGILTELGAKKDKLSPVVLGIGMNLNQGPRDFPRGIRETATSLYAVSRRRTDPARLLQRLLSHLEGEYRRVVERKFHRVLADWKKRSVTLGRQVKVSQGHRDFYGHAVDLDEKGALLIRTDIGVVERVTSGDVEALRLKPQRGGK